MKTSFFRIPVSKWNDSLASSFLTAAESELQVVKMTGKPEDYYLAPVNKQLVAAQRLVVLVPPGEFDERELAVKVGRLAQGGQKEILLVGLASEPLGDHLLRRRMENISSSLRPRYSKVGLALLYRSSWLEALREILKEDDRVICLENHYTTSRFFRNVNLAQAIASKLGIPVGVLQGMRLEVEAERRWAALREYLVWAAMLATIFFFLVLQIRIQQIVPGLLGFIVQIVTLAAEVGTIAWVSALGD